MLFWETQKRRRFYATTLTPQREKLLRSKYPSVSEENFQDIISDFRDKAEYIEWVLRQMAQNPEIRYDPRKYQGLVNWWDTAKTLKDPRIQQHDKFHQTGKWDIGAYSPERLQQIQTRYPAPVKNNELFFNHKLPAILVARKENPDGIWELVKLDSHGVQAEVEQEVYTGYNMIYRLLVDNLNVSLGYLEQILELNKGFININPLAIQFKTENQQSLLPGEVEDFVNRNIFGPLGKAGWGIHHDKDSHISNPSYDLIPPSMNKVVRLACQYGQGTNWCTTNVSTALGYLDEGPLYVVLKDGYPVAQAWVNIEDSTQFEIKNRKSRNFGGQEKGYDEVHDLLRTNTPVPTLNWVALENIINSEIETIKEAIDSEFMAGDLHWLPDKWNDQDADSLDYARRELKGIDWDPGYDKQAKEIIKNYITYFESSVKPEPYIQDAVMAVLNHRDWRDSVDTSHLDPDDEHYDQDVDMLNEDISLDLFQYLNDQVEAADNEIEFVESSLYERDRAMSDLEDHENELRSEVEDRDWDALLRLAQQAGRYWSYFPSNFDDILTDAAFQQD